MRENGSISSTNSAIFVGFDENAKYFAESGLPGISLLECSAPTLAL